MKSIDHRPQGGGGERLESGGRQGNWLGIPRGTRPAAIRPSRLQVGLTAAVGPPRTATSRVHAHRCKAHSLAPACRDSGDDQAVVQYQRNR